MSYTSRGTGLTDLVGKPYPAFKRLDLYPGRALPFVAPNIFEQEDERVHRFQ